MYWDLIGSLVIIVIVYAIRSSTRRGGWLAELADARGGRSVRDGVVIPHRGTTVHVRAIEPAHGWELCIEASAAVLVPSGLRLLRRRNWARRPLPEALAALGAAPVVARDDEGVTRSDTLSTLPAIDGLAAPWRVLMRLDAVLLGCDGARAFVRAEALPSDPEFVDALLDAVRALACWDGGLPAMLAAVPGARAAELPGLGAAVALEPDALTIGVRDGADLVAQLATARGNGSATATQTGVAVAGVVPAAAIAALARAGHGRLLVGPDGAELAWLGIPRDPARILAGVEALRSLAAADPHG